MVASLVSSGRFKGNRCSLHKKVRVRRIYGESAACVCAAEHPSISELWQEAQEEASHTHPMVSSEPHPSRPGIEEGGPRCNCHMQDGHREFHTSGSGHCSMKEPQSPLQRTSPSPGVEPGNTACLKYGAQK